MEPQGVRATRPRWRMTGAALAFGMTPLLLLIPWIARIVWSQGDVRFGGFAAHNGRVCIAKLAGTSEPMECFASFAPGMVVSLLAIIIAAVLAGSVVITARPRGLALSGGALILAWVALAFDGAFIHSAMPSARATMNLATLIDFLTQGWTLTRSLWLIGGGVGLLWTARIVNRSTPPPGASP